MWSHEREGVWQHGWSGCGRRGGRGYMRGRECGNIEGVGMTRCRKEWVWPQRYALGVITANGHSHGYGDGGTR